VRGSGGYPLCIAQHLRVSLRSVLKGVIRLADGPLLERGNLRLSVLKGSVRQCAKPFRGTKPLFL